MRKLMFGGAAAALLIACPLTALAQTSPHMSPRHGQPATTAPTLATPASPSTSATPAAPEAAPASPAAGAAASSNTFTDVQLHSFAAASREVDPISRGLTTSSTAEQRTQAATQIRAILTRNNIDSATYNAIAARAQTDTALAARIAALNATGATQGSAQTTTPPGSNTPGQN